MERFLESAGRWLEKYLKEQIKTLVRATISISIRVSEEELDKFKEAARLEAYSSYSEFIRRTALIEAARIIKENNEGEDTHEHN